MLGGVWAVDGGAWELCGGGWVVEGGNWNGWLRLCAPIPHATIRECNLIRGHKCSLCLVGTVKLTLIRDGA